MARFTTKDSNIFLIPNNPHMIHLGSIGYGIREFIVMLDRTTSKVYIEEVVLHNSESGTDTTAGCKFIEDDTLAYDLAKFCEEQGLTDMKRLAETLSDQNRFGLLNVRQER